MDVFKDAKVTGEGSHSYPITVRVVRDSDGKTVWEGSQKSLFRKYADNRTNAIKDIKEKLLALQ